MASRETLSAVDWIKAGFRALTLGGPQVIRAEAIARDLNVSKGSFYWHFKDLPAFKQAMLAHWQSAGTAQAITMIDQADATAEMQLQQLLNFATDNQVSDYGGMKVDAAIRNWALFDADAGSVVAEVDAARFAYLEALFGRCGKTSAQSRRNANIFYGALIGMQQFPADRGKNTHSDLSTLLELLLNSEAVGY